MGLKDKHDDFWRKANVDLDYSISPAGLPLAKTTPPDSWTLIELLCTDRSYRGHGVGKLLLVGALAYSAVKDRKTAAVLVVAETSEADVSKHLYTKLGFEEIPGDFFLPTADMN